jgi:shikimate kinase
MNIVLIGFMGSGKSTVARQLSLVLNLPWIDLDELVCKKTNTKTIIDLFTAGGEPLLRETEIAIAKEYASKNNTIISTGGGTVLNQTTLDYFTKTGGKVIFLNAQFHTIEKRLAHDNSRPLFNHSEKAKTLYDFRLPLYHYYADQTIDVDNLSTEETALKIKEMISNGL